ncbi:epoxide hydrolase 3-like isoform X1 [Ambystoma mexicanum]|uniref:epoxide hydrolase 3-like isoform X1 n=1 Tax=Ambystoma mexicanum TaxID=8296 RepID=UPI0037E8AF71
MGHFLSSVLLFPTRIVLFFTSLFYSLVIYAAVFLAAGLYSLSAMVLILKGPRRAFKWKARETAPSCLVDNTYGQHCYVRIKGSGMRFHYVASGEKGRPLMLLLHGFPENWFSWRNQLKQFCSRHWVVALDLRGYGSTDAPVGCENYKLDTLVADIKDVIEVLGYTQCILVGHDWGGILAWAFAVSHPEMVSKLIVMNAPHLPAFKDYALQHFSQLMRSSYIFMFQLPKLPELIVSLADFQMLKRALTDDKIGIQNPERRLTEEETEAFLYSMSKPGALTGPLNYYRNLLSSLPVKCQDVLVPTMVIWGERDQFLEVGMIEYSKQYVHRSFREERIPDAGHWVQQDQPEVVNQLMKSFLSDE